MSSFENIIAKANALLDTRIHQVIGSTPASIKDSILKCNMKNNPEIGINFVMLAVFAAAVNKRTMEDFYQESSLSGLRSTMNVAFLIENKPNMTAISLAGHCFLTVKELDRIRFVEQFKRKMGQDDIWAGSMDRGSISDKQKEILQAKSKAHRKEDATLFASGFLKYTGIIKTSMTAAESAFWNTSSVGLSSGTAQSAVAGRDLSGDSTARATGSVSPDLFADLGASQEVSGTVSFNRKSVNVEIPKDVHAYYFSQAASTEDKLADLIEKNGVDKVISNLRKKMAGQAATVING